MSIIINGMDMPKGNSTKNLLIYSDGRVFTGHKDDVNYSAEERKTGKWIDGKRMKNDGTFYWFRQCDQCGYERNDCDTEKDSNFCPNCGADMRGEQG